MENIINPGIRTIIVYLLLMFLSRNMGRKMISQMTFFEFVVGITIGAVAGSVMLGPYTTGLSSGVTVLVALTALVISLDYSHLRSFRLRKLVDSEPLVVIERGRIVDKNLSKERLTIEELSSLLRQKNYFNIADIEFAILEPDGQLSVLPKSHKRPLQPSDMNISPPYQGLAKDIIIDGIIMEENLKDTGASKQWLLNQLKNLGIEKVEEVFYGGLDSSQNLYISKRNVQREKHGKYGIE